MINTLVTMNEKVLREIEKEMRIRKTKQVFLLFSLGSQFDHLIKQILEKLGLYCLVADPCRVTVEDVRELNPIGIIISGGPASMYDNPPKFDNAIFDLQIPVLGICLGFQYWAKHIGCSIVRSDKMEFGIHELTVMSGSSKLFAGCGYKTMVLESHGDKIVPTIRLDVLGRTENAPVAAAQYMHMWGVQFHPEVTETVLGQRIFENFCFGICGAEKVQTIQTVGMEKISGLIKHLTGKKILLALSGGSDSCTVAYLLKAACVGKKFRAVYIKGIDRPDDEACVMQYFGDKDWLELVVVDATERFLNVLKGKLGMHEKRVAMRSVYKEVLEEEINKFGADFIAQGTLYTDLSESGVGHVSDTRAQIKLHHNVNLGFSIPELTPLSDCVKDTGRNIGRSIGVPEILLTRHPFPGPGLVVRIEGEVTAEKLEIARHADGIYIEELRKHSLYETVWQAGAVVTQSIVTCTKGDGAANGTVVRLWAVWSVNGFTAQAAELPWDFMKRVAQRITNEIHAVGSVDIRISGKPPAAIECG